MFVATPRPDGHHRGQLDALQPPQGSHSAVHNGSEAQQTNKSARSAASRSDGADHTAEQGAAQPIACCIVVLKVLGALLPPPFPSRQPARMYLGSLAVQPAWRRRGIGAAMLHEVEKLGAPAGLPTLVFLDCSNMRHRLLSTHMTEALRHASRLLCWLCARDRLWLLVSASAAEALVHGVSRGAHCAALARAEAHRG